MTGELDNVIEVSVSQTEILKFRELGLITETSGENQFEFTPQGRKAMTAFLDLSVAVHNAASVQPV